ILGRPNAGKSTLLNCLAQRDVAIVAPTPGTTRDILEVALDLGGYPVVLADTAGLRDERPQDLDPVEVEGIRRAKHAADTADLKILVIDGRETAHTDPSFHAWIGTVDLIVRTKVDLGLVPRSDLPSFLAVSALTQEGILVLIQKLTEMVAHHLDLRAAGSAAGSDVVLTRARHRAALEETLAALHRVTHAPLPDLAAEDLRLAARALGRLTGHVDVEDILDDIFHRFCIGK
ncbi:MAG: GTPase, partial [Alphaproteobacteria bacterium]